jgi:hypothetical protein
LEDELVVGQVEEALDSGAEMLELAHG